MSDETVEAASDELVERVRSDIKTTSMGYTFRKVTVEALIARIDHEVEAREQAEAKWAQTAALASEEAQEHGRTLARLEQAEAELAECRGEPLAGDPSEWPHQAQIEGLGMHLERVRAERDRYRAWLLSIAALREDRDVTPDDLLSSALSAAEMALDGKEAPETARRALQPTGDDDAE